MTVHAQLVRVGRLKGAGIIKRASKHNLREIAREIGGYGGIDGRRVLLNQVLRGATTAEGVAAAAAELLKQVKTTIRKDAVICIEVLFSLRPGSQVNQQAFFADSLAWIDAYFKVPVVSAVVHNDEGAPHLHVLIVPLVDGCMRGSDLVSSRYKLIALHADFHEVVGKPHGMILVKSRKPSKSNPRVPKEAGKEKTNSMSLLGFDQPPALTKHQRLELLTWQFTAGIQQKLARGSHRWSH